MSKTNSGLVNYCLLMVGKPYWYGTYGQTASASLYSSKKKQYPDKYTASDFKSQYGQRVHDCAGLIKGYLWSDTPTSTPKYNAKQDFGATAFYEHCSKRGEISTFDRVNGRLVFKGSNQKMKHVGVYYDGYVLEAKGHAYGVVKSKFDDKWTHWGQCNLIEDDTQQSAGQPEKPAETPLKSVHDIAVEVIDGKWGNGAERKSRLKEAGYNPYEVQAEVNSILKGSQNSAPAPAYRTYTVKKGDTLWQIAQKYLGKGSRYKEIKSLNGLKSDTIRIGQVLKLPAQ